MRRTPIESSTRHRPAAPEVTTPVLAEDSNLSTIEQQQISSERTIPRPERAGMGLVDKTISHYRILEKLGEGGMGVVYKAEDTSLHRPVALKFLRPDVLGSDEHQARFVREAQAAAALDHHNICTIHEIGKAGGQTFLAMAYIEGATVSDKIKEGHLTLEEALDIAIQAGEGLQAAHEKGIVHRDIKSTNLIVTVEGNVKVMDFGLAQRTDQTRLTKTDAIVGTPVCMSPEQVRGQPTDRRTDIWSLGVVIYEMVAGRLPFGCENAHAVLYSIVHEAQQKVTPWNAIWRAILNAWLGNKDEAFRWLNYEPHHTWLTAVVLDWFKPLHGDPRHLALCRRMNLPPP